MAEPGLGRGVATKFVGIRLRDGMTIAEVAEQLSKLPNNGALFIGEEEVFINVSAGGKHREATVNG